MDTVINASSFLVLKKEPMTKGEALMNGLLNCFMSISDKEKNIKGHVYYFKNGKKKWMADQITNDYLDIADQASNIVTENDVKENMENIKVKTMFEFGQIITYVMVKMKNGFILTESSICNNIERYDENVAKKNCLKKIKDKIWFLLRYQMQEDKYNKKI